MNNSRNNGAVNFSKNRISNNEKIIITAALPYANGPIHIGHLLEYIQADIFSRFLKLQGKDALYICASDMHGTPIEVNATKAGIKPELFVEKYWQEHQRDFASFLIQFDNYYKTHSPENKMLAELFYTTLKKKDLIYRKKIKVMYCPVCKRSLPDRYIKGICPHCQMPDQYGDICEKCSSVLKGVDLVSPYCVLCKNTPIEKESEHYFFKLSSFSAELRKWIENSDSFIQAEVRNWLEEWLSKGLEDWCISRDGPYFGFSIPDALSETGEEKYFYVWLDAPIGYISSTQNYCVRRGLSWEDYWYKGQVYHFIGKDIAYFHYLFWPAMLMGMDIPVPKINMHGFITVNGQKMSKSRGTFFTASDFLALYPAESLRFYYASHLDRKVVDVDLSLEEFKAVNNNVLVGSLGNFCYRVLTFAQKNYGEVNELASEQELSHDVLSLLNEVQKYYLALDFKSAVRVILQIADKGNAYFQKSEVWKEKESIESKKVVGWCVNLARNLAIIAQPILPAFSLKIEKALGGAVLSLEDIRFNWKGKLHDVELLVMKIEDVAEFKKEVNVVDVNYTISSSVEQLGVKVRLAQFTGLKIKKRQEGVEKLKSEVEHQIDRYDHKFILQDYDRIDKETNVDFVKNITAVRNLINLIKEKGKLPQINTVVDIYNSISVETGIAMATHDLTKIEGEVDVRLSKSNEPFTFLDGTLEKLTGGEVVYVDDAKVLGRFSKQCKQTITTVDSTDVILIMFGNKSISDEQMDDAVKKTSELIVQFNGGSYKIKCPAIKSTFPLRLMIGEVKEAKDHPNADSLYVLKVDFGAVVGQKQVVAGLKKHLSKEELVGRRAVFCVNMKAAKLRGELSEAMILVAEEADESHLSLLSVEGSGADAVTDVTIGDEVGFEGMSFAGKEVTYDDFKKLSMSVLASGIIYERKKLMCKGKKIVVLGVRDGGMVR